MTTNKFLIKEENFLDKNKWPDTEQVTDLGWGVTSMLGYLRDSLDPQQKLPFQNIIYHNAPLGDNFDPHIIRTRFCASPVAVDLLNDRKWIREYRKWITCS